MYYCRVLFLSVVCAGSLLTQVRAADVAVSVRDNFFDPRNVTINVNDQVTWTWTGVQGHTSTGPLWNSGYKSSGTFSFVFSTAGTFNYLCTVIDHIGMNGSVTVQGGNTPPTVTLTSPTNGAIFAAPATVAIQASATHTDGTISQVQFFTNSASLLIDTTAAYEATAANLPAGTYNLLAVATDNRNASATSSVATISVVNPVDVVLSGVQRLSGTNFQFRYTANPGLRYVVERSPILTNWSSVATNTARGASESFTDAINTDRNFYRVRRLPNP